VPFSFRWVFMGLCAYRDKEVVGVFVRFRAPLHSTISTRYPYNLQYTSVGIGL
jgi:hypothetical protein